MNIKRYSRWIWGALLVGAVACSPYERLSKTDLSYRYGAETPLQVDSKVLDEGGQMRVFLDIKASKLGDDATLATLNERYGFSYRITPSYRSKETIVSVPSLEFSGFHGRNSDGTFHVSFPLAKIGTPSALMVLTATEKASGKAVMFDIPISFADEDLKTKYALFPIRHNYPAGPYVTTRDTVVIRSLRNDAQPLMVRYFSDAFRPALPPMAITNSIKNRPEETQTYQLRPGEVMKFVADGLYFAQEDTNSREGFSFVVNPNRFPRVTRATELIEPLIYITTRKEREKLLSSENPKLALDAFWLKLSNNNREYARRMIREYYTRVQEANALFTTFKQGWMTDQGMTYIIFGPPQKMLRYNDREEWYYEKSASMPEVYFTFLKRPTIFTDENYELVRYNEFDRVWYASVEQWRKGIVRR
ncbi:GWxTD domain-containing protein [Catalinimonas alkaloidigena]|nr:GWxTD domain-containing protein [Catalinimonas alkaloidigena]